jgi:leucyl aminopeptidase (aminopeptidase T)
VVIYGGVRDMELLENLYTHTRAVGAFPMLSMGSDRLVKRYYQDVPTKYDSQRPEFDMALTEVIDVQISIEVGESFDLLDGVPMERIQAVASSYVPVNDLFTERSVRFVSLGNGLYPMAARAEMLGMTTDQLSDVFWNGINVDYGVLNDAAEGVKARLSAGKEIHITNPNGTDFTAQIQSRPILTTDGTISDEDLAMGGSACQVWLPAGEVFLTPVPGTANGTIVVDRQFYRGIEINGLTMTFADGKLVSMDGPPTMKALKDRYDAAGDGKEEFAFRDIGSNPKVSIPPDTRMVAWMASGMVTVGIGSNVWAGGDNNAAYSMANFLPGCTVVVDGEVIVENGVLK